MEKYWISRIDEQPAATTEFSWDTSVGMLAAVVVNLRSLVHLVKRSYSASR